MHAHVHIHIHIHAHAHVHIHIHIHAHAHTHTHRAKVTLENKRGDTALEVAKNWGDDFIYAIVYAKFTRLPPPVDKKGN